MSRIIDAIRKLTSRLPEDDNALRRRVRELEAENQTLREKLAWRGPWML